MISNITGLHGDIHNLTWDDDAVFVSDHTRWQKPVTEWTDDARDLSDLTGAKSTLLQGNDAVAEDSSTDSLTTVAPPNLAGLAGSCEECDRCGVVCDKDLRVSWTSTAPCSDKCTPTAIVLTPAPRTPASYCEGMHHMSCMADACVAPAAQQTQRDSDSALTQGSSSACSPGPRQYKTLVAHHRAPMSRAGHPPGVPRTHYHYCHSILPHL